jgi:hypothetical protein
MNPRTVLLFSLFALAVTDFGQTPGSKANQNAARPTPPAAQYAKWAPLWEAWLGITETEFKAAGLGRLSAQEATNLLSTISSHRPMLTCGPSYGPKETDEYHYVHLYVSGSDADAEFVGLLRGKLSAIRDVRMVASDDEADLGVSILTIPNESDSHKFGITASTNIYEPCVYQVNGGLGNGTSKIYKLVDAIINTGPDEDSIASRIANTLDARDFDEIRQNHAQILKYVQP